MERSGRFKNERQTNKSEGENVEGELQGGASDERAMSTTAGKDAPISAQRSESTSKADTITPKIIELTPNGSKSEELIPQEKMYDLLIPADTGVDSVVKKKAIDVKPVVYDDLLTGNAAVTYKNFGLVFHDYHFVDEVVPYYSMNGTYLRKYEADTRVIEQVVIKKLVEKSNDLIRYGTASISVGINSAWAEKVGLKIVDGVIEGELLFSRLGSEVISNEDLKSLSGKLMMLYYQSVDSRILLRDKEVFRLDNFDIGDLQEAVRPSFPLPADPHPILSCLHTSIDFLREHFSDILKLKTYKYGVLEEPARLGNIKRISVQARNMDMVTASILNYNICRIEETNTDAEYQKLLMLKAHSVGGTFASILSRNDSHSDINFDGGMALKCHIIRLINDPVYPSEIRAINEKFFREANLITPSQNNREFEGLSPTDPGFTPIYNYMKTRIGTVDVDTIYSYFAAEFSPMARVPRLEFDKQGNDHYSLLKILEYVLFSMIFPGLFVQISGDIQTDILRLIWVFKSTELSTFMSKYGTSYKLDKDKNPVYTKNSKTWNQRDYLSDLFPSFWAFPLDTANRKSLPSMCMIRDMFNEIGVYTPDHRAVAAGFPRLKSPYHYVPFKIQADDTINGVSIEFTRVIKIFISLMQTLNFEDSTKVSKNAFRTYTRHMRKEFDRIAFALTNFYAPLCDTVGNFMLNIMTNRIQDFTKQKPMRFCLNSAYDGPEVQHNEASPDSPTDVINPAVVWTILFRCSFGAMSTHSNIMPVQPIRLTFPYPLDSLLSMYTLSKKNESIVDVDFFISYLINLSDVYYNVTYLDDEGVPIYSLVRADEYDRRIARVFEVYCVDSYTLLVNDTINDVRKSAKSLVIDVGLQIPYGFLRNLCDDGYILHAVNDFDLEGYLKLDPQVIIQPLVDKQSIGLLLDRYDYMLSHRMRDMLTMYKNMQINQFRNLANALRDIMGSSSPTHGKFKFPDGSAALSLARLYHAQISRYDGYNVLRYDPLVDPIFMKPKMCHRKSECKQRMMIGLQGLTNTQFQDELIGLYVFKRRHAHLSPYSIPNIKPEYIILKYNPSMFRMISTQTYNLLKFLYNDRAYPAGDQDLPLVCMEIPLGTRLEPNIIQYLLTCVEESKWILKLVDMKYKPTVKRVSELPSEIKNPSTLELLTRYLVNRERPVILFYDTTFLCEYSRYSTAQTTIPTQYLFPMEYTDPSQLYQSLLEDTESVDRRPASLIFPQDVFYDTGAMDLRGRLLYSDKKSKLDGDYISFTNVIKTAFRNNFIIDPKIDIQLTFPVTSEEIRLGGL